MCSTRTAGCWARCRLWNTATRRALVNDSGRSSWEYLQNIAPEGAAGHQELAVTLALCRRLLRGRGAVRVHGGGFAGTALCMVPGEDYPAFRAELEALLAPDCCHRLQIV